MVVVFNLNGAANSVHRLPACMGGYVVGGTWLAGARCSEAQQRVWEHGTVGYIWRQRWAECPNSQSSIEIVSNT